MITILLPGVAEIYPEFGFKDQNALLTGFTGENMVL